MAVCAMCGWIPNIEGDACRIERLRNFKGLGISVFEYDRQYGEHLGNNDREFVYTYDGSGRVIASRVSCDSDKVEINILDCGGVCALTAGDPATQDDLQKNEDMINEVWSEFREIIETVFLNSGLRSFCR